jgi:hypothetical protein
VRPAVRAHLAVGTLLLGLYAWSESVGFERRAAPAQRIAESVRQSPGGWRTWTFWHRGVRGGK